MDHSMVYKNRNYVSQVVRYYFSSILSIHRSYSLVTKVRKLSVMFSQYVSHNTKFDCSPERAIAHWQSPWTWTWPVLACLEESDSVCSARNLAGSLGRIRASRFPTPVSSPESRRLFLPMPWPTEFACFLIAHTSSQTPGCPAAGVTAQGPATDSLPGPGST